MDIEWLSSGKCNITKLFYCLLFYTRLFFFFTVERVITWDMIVSGTISILVNRLKSRNRYSQPSPSPYYSKVLLFEIMLIYHICSVLQVFVYVCACVIRAILPGLWIRSRSFTERALTTPPKWRRNPGGKEVNVKKGYSWNTQNGDGGVIQNRQWWPTGILANVMKTGELLYWNLHT